MTLLAIFDGLLVILLTLRLIRLVITDDLGHWLIQGPAKRYLDRREHVPMWKLRLFSGLDCPFCVGFWLGVLVLGSLAIAGGPGADGGLMLAWRWIAAAFALNYVAGHVAARQD